MMRRYTYTETTTARAAALRLLEALQVLTLTPAIVAFLETNDPKALEQAQRAIALATPRQS
jgi:hypothetical protein